MARNVDSEYNFFPGQQDPSPVARQRDEFLLPEPTMPNSTSSPSYESLDYDELESELSISNAISKTKKFFKVQELMRWLIVLVIGIVIAVVGVFMDVLIVLFCDIRHREMMFVYNRYNHAWLVGLVYVVHNLVLSVVACLLSLFLAPQASKGGIDEVKCYLNGIKVPHIFRINMAISTFIGAACISSSGLALGPEGPMIHLGTIVAAGVSQVKIPAVFKSWSSIMKSFRNDREKRNFVGSGAAAGMAVALESPMGGSLFALEEGASFWNQALIWKNFFCSIASVFFANILLAVIRYPHENSQSKIGPVDCLPSIPFHSCTFYYFPLILLLGAIGGLAGALFNVLNTNLMKFRIKYVKKKSLKFLELVIASILTSLVGFLLSAYLYRCYQIKSSNDSKSEDDGTISFFCPAGEYNDMASIFFLDQKNAFRQVLWNSDSFGNRTLFLFSLVYFLLNTWVVGLSVPHGLLMPTILNGAVIGRLVGNLIGNWFPSKCVQPEMFALIGAASLLGGKSRMTISLTAVLIESTNNIVYAMPLMFTLMVSKWVGDWFGPGIYDSYIEIKGYPFLDWEPHPALYKFKAKQVMGHPVQTFSSRPLVKTVVDTLRKTTHNGFPIVTKSGVLQGLILRTQLLTLLKEKAFYSSVLVRNYYPSVTLESFIKDYPRYDSIENIILTQQEENMRMNLVPYMASNLFVMHQDASMKRLFVAFRSLGLRHLIIVDRHNVVVGIITRKDLFLQRLLEKVREADV